MTQEFSPEEIAALELALETGEIMRQPTEPQLDDQTFWYLPAAGSSPGALLFHARQAHAIDGVLAGEYVALRAALPVKTILARSLTPIGDNARQALGTWLDEHADSNTMDPHMERMEQIEHLLNRLLPHVGIYAPAHIVDSGATLIDAGPLRLRLNGDEWLITRDDSAERHLDTLRFGVGLLNDILPFVGVHRPVQIEPIERTSLLIGNVRATPSAQGWTVAVDPDLPEELDVALPEGAAFDWNDVLDAAIAARNDWRPSSYLQVVHVAVGIGTQSALDFLSNYSDDQSPAHELAVQALAEALGRQEEWHTALMAGQKAPVDEHSADLAGGAHPCEIGA